MKILAIKNYINNDENFTKYTFLGIHKTSINIIQSTDLHYYSLVELSNSYDKLIVLGGKESVLKIDKYPYLDLIINLIHLFNNQNKHILGICLGFQLIAKAFGGTVKKLPKLNMKCATNINIIKETNFIKKDMEKEYIICFHEDYVHDSGDMEIIGKYNDIPYIIQKNNILGVQFHPDVFISRFLCCVKNNKTLTDDTKKSIIEHTLKNKERINNYNKEFMKKWIMQ